MQLIKNHEILAALDLQSNEAVEKIREMLIISYNEGFKQGHSEGTKSGRLMGWDEHINRHHEMGS